jgi:hypothetical protein
LPHVEQSPGLSPLPGIAPSVRKDFRIDSIGDDRLHRSIHLVATTLEIGLGLRERDDGINAPHNEL